VLKEKFLIQIIACVLILLCAYVVNLTICEINHIGHRSVDVKENYLSTICLSASSLTNIKSMMVNVKKEVPP